MDKALAKTHLEDLSEKKNSYRTDSRSLDTPLSRSRTKYTSLSDAET